MAKVHAITFLISCEYVSVNWSDSSLKHEMCHVISKKAVLVVNLECRHMSAGLKVLAFKYTAGPFNNS